MTRRRFQRGSIYKKGKRNKVWVARFFEDVITPDGTVTRIRRSERLGAITEIPTRRQAEQLLQDRLRLFNSSDYRPSSSCTDPTENSISVKKVKQSSCGKRIPRLPGRRSLLLPPKRQCVSFSA